MNIRKVLGDNVKKYRLNKNLSQEKFSEMCNLHRTYISDIECYQRNVSIDNIEKIAKALNITVSELLFNDKE